MGLKNPLYTIIQYYGLPRNLWHPGKMDGTYPIGRQSQVKAKTQRVWKNFIHQINRIIDVARICAYDHSGNQTQKIGMKPKSACDLLLVMSGPAGPILPRGIFRPLYNL